MCFTCTKSAKCLIFQFPKGMQQHTQDVVGKLIWFCRNFIALCNSERILQIDEELTKL